ncbi:MAG: GDYXXLXY domain-containing protein [Proteobacteria bacterium]|nr:GDYXXLXY domain-containing protein [Pseudomonadota bacterium]
MSQSRINLRVFIAVAIGVLILVFLNWSIFQRERLIEQGRIVLLQLAPVDPRSLMQGDYMALRFALANEIGRFKLEELGKDGRAVLKLDENNVAHFVRIDDGSPLQQGEVRLQYRIRDEYGTVKIVTNAFFFEEGRGSLYESARYGELRVSDTGNAVLTQLRDERFNVLGRSAVLN